MKKNDSKSKQNEKDLLSYYRDQKKLVSKVEKLRCSCDWEKDLASKIMASDVIKSQKKCESIKSKIPLINQNFSQLKNKIKFIVGSMRFSLVGPMISASAVVILAALFIKTGVAQPAVEEVALNQAVVKEYKNPTVISVANLMRFHSHIRKGYAKRKAQMIRERYMLNATSSVTYRLLSKPSLKNYVQSNTQQSKTIINPNISKQIMKVYHEVFSSSNNSFKLMNTGLILNSDVVIP